MSQTAVGLFEDASVAEAAVGSLRAHGFPSSGVRIVSAQNGASMNGSGDEFSSGLSKDLRTMGVTDIESGAYLSAMRNGRVLVYATGSAKQVAEAATIMNEYSAIEIDEFINTNGASNGNGSNGVIKNGVIKTTDMGKINPESRLPESQVTIGAHETSYTTHSSRSKKEGARVFSW